MNTNEEKLKYIFAAYLDMALKREKKDYLNKKSKHDAWVLQEQMEIRSETEQEWKNSRVQLTMENRDEKELIDFAEAFEDSKVYNALLRLKKQEREILFLRIYKELSYKEIGKMFGISDQKAASIYHYACKKIRKGMESK